MSKQEIMIFAHNEARALVAKRGCSYAQAMSIGLRRAHNENQHKLLAASYVMDQPKFMWLRGM